MDGDAKYADMDMQDFRDAVDFLTYYTNEEVWSKYWTGKSDWNLFTALLIAGKLVVHGLLWRSLVRNQRDCLSRGNLLGSMGFRVNQDQSKEWSLGACWAECLLVERVDVEVAFATLPVRRPYQCTNHAHPTNHIDYMFARPFHQIFGYLWFVIVIP